MKINFIWSHQP